jgi:hypothetical protein
MTLSESTKNQNQYSLLQKENLALKRAVKKIEKRLASLEASIPVQKTIVLREISKEQAKIEIQDLFSRGDILYYSDIAEKLRIDLSMAVDLCNEMQTEGVIEKVDDLL